MDDTLFFGPNFVKIENVVISELEDNRYALTHEEGNATSVFLFLGLSITPDPTTNTITLTQVGWSH